MSPSTARFNVLGYSQRVRTIVGMDATVGERVRVALKRAASTTQRQLASDVGMTPDALSRSLNGERRFSASELALIGRALGVSVDWLITGERNPFEPKLSARHAFDHSACEHVDHSWARALDAVSGPVVAYEQVGYSGHGSPEGFARLSAVDAARQARVRLEEAADGSFLQDLPAAVEAAFGVHVFVLPDHTDDAYAGETHGQPFIVVGRGGDWYRKNLGLAHELGHVLHGDLAYPEEKGHAGQEERWANAFAAELLEPAGEMRIIDWPSLSRQEIAGHLLSLGVSSYALRIRLASLGLPASPLLDESTEQLIKGKSPFVVAARRRTYLVPRFPQDLVSAHQAGVENGDLLPQTLAWMLGVEPEDIATPYSGSDSVDTVDEIRDGLDLA